MCRESEPHRRARDRARRPGRRCPRPREGAFRREARKRPPGFRRPLRRIRGVAAPPPRAANLRKATNPDLSLSQPNQHLRATRLAGRVEAHASRYPHVRESMGVYRAEYIWIDGTQPTQKLRSKTKIVPDGEKPPIWAFDGSSTQQATGDRSDCVLQPVFSCPDPIRGGGHLLLLFGVQLGSGKRHPSKMRRANADMAGGHASFFTSF